jgi:hypothetical protein
MSMAVPATLKGTFAVSTATLAAVPTTADPTTIAVQPCNISNAKSHVAIFI